MADTYLDEGASGANDGSSPTDAWESWADAVAAHATPDTCWIRRTTATVVGADLAPGIGTISAPIKWIGWPRASKTINCDWVNGSTTVDNVDSNDLARSEHQGRYITGPDGEQYFITRIVDANTFIIEREYAGATAANQNVVISADDDYSTRPAAGTAAGWDADGDSLALMDFNDAAFQLVLSTKAHHVFKNIEFKDSTDSSGIVLVLYSKDVSFIGCLFLQSTANARLLYVYGLYIYLERCILEGSGVGSVQRGIVCGAGGGTYGHLKDVAIYNCGDYGIFWEEILFLESVNIGVELANADDDIGLGKNSAIFGRDVKLGGSLGDVTLTTAQLSSRVIASFENYQRVLGDHKAWFILGTYESADTSGETPNTKLSSNVIKITPNISQETTIDDWFPVVLEHEVKAIAGSQTFKYYIYNNSMGTLNSSTAKDDIYLKAEHVKEYDDTSEYVIAEEFSAETAIANAADADDWDFLSVTINPATSSKVRLKIYFSKYSAAGEVFIDPQVVIT